MDTGPEPATTRRWSSSSPDRYPGASVVARPAPAPAPAGQQLIENFVSAFHVAEMVTSEELELAP
jgi:hypothetical protein